MKVSQIHQIFAQCGLPILDTARLHELARIEGKNFEKNIEQASTGNTDSIAYLANMIRAGSPDFMQVLHNNGYIVSVRRLIELAKQDGTTLFRAIVELRSKGPQLSEAIEYLNHLFTADAAPVTNDQLMRNPPTSADNTSRLHDSTSAHDDGGFDCSPARTNTDASNQNAARQIRTKSEPNLPAGELTTASHQAKPTFYSFNIFGNKAALCVAEDRTRKGELPTIRMEASPRVGGHCNWNQKIAVQLTINEMKLVLAVFSDKLGAIQLDGHGAAHDKVLAIENQEAHYFVRIGQKGRGYGVPVSPADSTAVISLLYKQILLGEPHLDARTLDLLISNMAAKIVSASSKSHGS